uniref:Uncharacterized protein n=1 Tax=Bifidobacterium longum TaxID=216816 RepID=Q5FBA9_BIFLN|nr:hypothetical protein [Bifidobacterium longum]
MVKSLDEQIKSLQIGRPAQGPRERPRGAAQGTRTQGPHQAPDRGRRDGRVGRGLRGRRREGQGAHRPPRAARLPGGVPVLHRRDGQLHEPRGPQGHRRQGSGTQRQDQRWHELEPPGPRLRGAERGMAQKGRRDQRPMGQRRGGRIPAALIRAGQPRTQDSPDALRWPDLTSEKRRCAPFLNLL